MLKAANQTPCYLFSEEEAAGLAPTGRPSPDIIGLPAPRNGFVKITMARIFSTELP